RQIVDPTSVRHLFLLCRSGVTQLVRGRRPSLPRAPIRATATRRSLLRAASKSAGLSRHRRSSQKRSRCGARVARRRNPMKNFELVIAGGGLAGARAIKSYRESGGGGQIALLPKESDLPYHRPALSKRYLRGETTNAPFAEDPAFYCDHGVEVLLETTATGLDTPARTLATDAGTFHYNKLLIATGTTPRRLHVAGADLEGRYALRTLRDSQAIRRAAGADERAVVVGGGFIGMEVAASLRQLGLTVTLIHLLGPGLVDQFRSAPGLQ